MALVIVHHATDRPALFAAAAAVVAHELHAPLRYLAPHFDLARFPDAEQHVGSDRLLPSGLIWHARNGETCEPPRTLETLLDEHLARDVVIPWHPAWYQEGVLEQIGGRAESKGIAVRHVEVIVQGDVWRFASDVLEIRPYHRDRYGRFIAGAPGVAHSAPLLSIVLLGTKREQRDTYPAILAALGDAADALGIALDVQCIGAPDATPHDFAGKAGLVLPGGASMHNVQGQVRAAGHALAEGMPVVGLCLGMQSMSTAVARTLPEGDGIHMAEAMPDAAIKSFVPMRGVEGLVDFRVGLQPTRATGNPLGDTLLGELRDVHCNHRYMLNPTLVRPLERAGLHIVASDETGHIADAVRLDGHPFFAGMQGHPELASRPGHAHPLLAAFLRVARGDGHA